jgi:hypothetical protein
LGRIVGTDELQRIEGQTRGLQLRFERSDVAVLRDSGHD